MGRATARAPIDNPGALKAPLFRSVVERFETGDRRIILDLGAASTPMLALFGRCPCRVDIADLAANDGIDRLNAAAPGASLTRTIEALLPGHPESAPLDFVFCWDLMNYLGPAALSALSRNIASRAGPGTLLHALIVYSERTMPACPGRFLPGDDGTLVNRGVTNRVIEAPRYSPENLRHMLGDFTIERAILLGNGMQEFLFRRNP